MKETTEGGVKTGEYKGKLTLSLPTGNEKYPFTFGVAKAKLILKHLDDIKKFIEVNDEKNKEER